MALTPVTAMNLMPYEVYAHHGRQVIQEHNNRLKEILGIPSDLPVVRLEPVQTATESYNVTDPVGILGGGEIVPAKVVVIYQ